MIQKIVSKRVELPTIFLVENEEDFATLPKGLPFIVGRKEELDFITVFLEFQVLYKSCIKTGLSINWLDCLKRLGFNNLRKYELNSGGTFPGAGSEGKGNLTLEAFVEDQYLVNFDKLAELKVLPVWLNDLRASIETNIINEVMFDPTAFNKQLGLNVGSAGLKVNKKNLLILDVSASMPDGVVKTITNLAKLMSKRFYADVIVTGGQSYFVDYEEVQKVSIVDMAAKAGRSNEGEMYKKIMLMSKDYGTVISFGDDDNPGREIPTNFKIENLYSLHTNGNRSSRVTGYACCLKPSNKTIIVKDWIETIQ